MEGYEAETRSRVVSARLVKPREALSDLVAQIFFVAIYDRAHRRQVRFNLAHITQISVSVSDARNLKLIAESPHLAFGKPNEFPSQLLVKDGANPLQPSAVEIFECPRRLAQTRGEERPRGFARDAELARFGLLDEFQPVAGRSIHRFAR